jgi:serine/threonine protein kinase
MNLSQDLAEVLIKNANSVENLVKYIKHSNCQGLKFAFNGEINLDSCPNLIFSNEVIDGDVDHFIHMQINNYLSELNLIQDQVFRSQPWLKLNQNLYKEEYRRFDLTGHKFENHKFFDIPVRFIPVDFTSNMLVPKELWMLFNLSFPEISTVFGFSHINDSTFVVVQSYPFCLEQIITNNATKGQVFSIFKQLASVTAILHSKQVFGFRFSLKNVEVDQDGLVKVSDFSAAVLLSEFDERRLEIMTEDLKCFGIFVKDVLFVSRLADDDDLFVLAGRLANSQCQEEASELLNLFLNDSILTIS